MAAWRQQRPRGLDADDQASHQRLEGREPARVAAFFIAAIPEPYDISRRQRDPGSPTRSVGTGRHNGGRVSSPTSRTGREITDSQVNQQVTDNHVNQQVTDNHFNEEV